MGKCIQWIVILSLVLIPSADVTVTSAAELLAVPRVDVHAHVGDLDRMKHYLEVDRALREEHQVGVDIWIDLNFLRSPDQTADAYLQTVVDYRRGIDFLATRSEIDTTRIGVFGGSMGATQAMILAPIEPRIKAVILRGPGLWADQWDPPPTDQVNFLPRMGDRPVLIFNGPYDHPWAAQGTQRALKLLPGETRMVWYKTTHTVPPRLYLKAMLP